MRDKFWSLMYEFLIAEHYFKYYSHDATKWDRIISAICFITTAACVASWQIWERIPLVWSAIVCFSQLVSICKPLYPFAKRIASCKQIIQDVSKMNNELEAIWGADGSEIVDNIFNQYIKDYRDKLDACENRYSEVNLFPVNKRIHNKAQDDVHSLLLVRYNIKEGNHAKS